MCVAGDFVGVTTCMNADVNVNICRYRVSRLILLAKLRRGDNNLARCEMPGTVISRLVIPSPPRRCPVGPPQVTALQSSILSGSYNVDLFGGWAERRSLVSALTLRIWEQIGADFLDFVIYLMLEAHIGVALRGTYIEARGRPGVKWPSGTFHTWLSCRHPYGVLR